MEFKAFERVLQSKKFFEQNQIFNKNIDDLRSYL